MCRMCLREECVYEARPGMRTLYSLASPILHRTKPVLIVLLAISYCCQGRATASMLGAFVNRHVSLAPSLLHRTEPLPTVLLASDYQDNQLPSKNYYRTMSGYLQP